MPSEVNGLAAGVGVGVGETVGVGLGDGLGVAVGIGVGVGVGVGADKAFASKLPGLLESGVVGVDDVALDENTIHLPSLLITGRRLTISTRVLLAVAVLVVSNKTLLVSVI